MMNKKLAAAFDLYERDKDPDVFLATLQALCLSGDKETTQLLIRVWDLLIKADRTQGEPTRVRLNRFVLDLMGLDNSTSVDYLRKGVHVYSWARD